MNVPSLPSLFGAQQEQLFDTGRYSPIDLLSYPSDASTYSSNNNTPMQHPSSLSLFPTKLFPKHVDMTQSVLDYENLLLESSRTYSARSTASLISQDSRGDNNNWQLNNRTSSPIGVLNDIRDSPQVLTNKGVANIHTQQFNRQQEAEVQAQLTTILSSLLTLQQQSSVGGLLQEAQYNNNNNTGFPVVPCHAGQYAAPMVANNQNNSVQPIPHQVDLMQQILNNPVGNHLYKTEICRAYDETKKCRFGDRCKYAHGQGELRQLMRGGTYKTKICKSFVEDGYCPYGSRCNFVHKLPGPQVKVAECLPSGNSSSRSTTGPLSESGSANSSPLCSSRSGYSSSSSSARLPIFQQLTDLGSLE